jgi:hypothetical protein
MKMQGVVNIQLPFLGTFQLPKMGKFQLAITHLNNQCFKEQLKTGSLPCPW